MDLNKGYFRREILFALTSPHLNETSVLLVEKQPPMERVQKKAELAPSDPDEPNTISLSL